MQDVAILHPGMPARGLRRLSAVAMFLLLLILPLNSTVAVPLGLPGIGGLGPLHSSLPITPILTVAVVVLGVLQYWRDSRRRALSVGPPLLAIPVIALVVLGVITVPLSINPGQSLSASFYHVQLLALYLVAVNCPVERRVIAAGLALGAVLQAIVGWPQFLLGHSFGLGALGEYTVDAASSGVSVVMMGQTRLLRAYGLTGHPNQLAGYLMFSIPVIIGGLPYSTGGRYFRLLLSMAAVIGLSALLVTFSRASCLGLAAAATSMFLLLRRRQAEGAPFSTPARLILAISVLVIVGFAASSWQPLLGRLRVVDYATESQSIEERSNLNGFAWNLIRQRPILGVGLGNFIEGAALLLPDQAPDFPGETVHNTVLLATAELGFLGGLLWIGLMALPWVQLWRFRGSIALTPWTAGLYGSLAALAVVSLLDYYLWCTLRGGVMLWLTWGLLAGEWNKLCIGRSRCPSPTLSR